MPHLLADPEFWVAVAFVIFLGFAAWLGAFKALVDGLDQRGARIAAELAEAKRLREEAQALLASYEKRRHEAEAEAAAIIAQAKVEADRLAREAQAQAIRFRDTPAKGRRAEDRPGRGRRHERGARRGGRGRDPGQRSHSARPFQGRRRARPADEEPRRGEVQAQLRFGMSHVRAGLGPAKSCLAVQRERHG